MKLCDSKSWEVMNELSVERKIRENVKYGGDWLKCIGVVLLTFYLEKHIVTETGFS